MNNIKKFFLFSIFLICLNFALNIKDTSETEDMIDQGIINEEVDEKRDLPTISAHWSNFTFIHIKNNWSNGVNWGWIKGDGSWAQPYTIENMTINAASSLTGSGIIIDNSTTDYFVIKNCTIINAGSGNPDAGIFLNDTNNGRLENNTCSSNYNGIYMSNSDNNTIFDNTLFQNSYCGLNLWSNCDNNTIWYNNASGSTISHGILVYQSNNFNKILFNNLTNNNLEGLSIGTSYNNTISYNTIKLNQEDGIRVGGGDENNYTDNWIMDNVYYGIRFEGSSHYNIIEGNYIYSNDRHGVYISGTSLENTIEDNNISSNLMYGIYIASSSNNYVINNFVWNNTQYGITVVSSNDVDIIDNEIIENGDDGISTDSMNNFIQDNKVINNTNTGIHLNFPGARWYNDIIHNEVKGNKEYGIWLEGVMQRCLIADNNVTLNSRHGIYIASGCSNNTIYNNNVSCNLWGGIYIASAQYTNVTDNYIWNNTREGINILGSDNCDIINNDIIDNKEEGIYTTSMNLLIKYNRIEYNSLTGVYLSFAGARWYNDIINNDIKGNGEYGVWLEGVMQRCLIADNNITANVRHGVYIASGCSNNTIYNNNVSCNLWGGIYIASAQYTNVTNNYIWNNTRAGIAILGSDDCDIINNDVIENKEEGINTNSMNLLIKYNRIEYNSLTGVYLSFAGARWYNDIINNNIEGNGEYGVWLEGIMQRCLIADNNITANVRHGIYIASGCTNNTIFNNNVSSNLWSGVYIGGAQYTNVTDNYIWNNTRAGIDVLGSDDCDIINNDVIENKEEGINTNSMNLLIKDNTIVNNSLTGVYLSFAGARWYNDIINNNIEGNGGHGVLLEGIMQRCLIVDNNITDNTLDGIYISPGCTNNTIDNNLISGNSVNGIRLNTTSYCNLTRNRILNNYQGIYLFPSSTYNIIDNNTMAYNSYSGISISENSMYNIINNNNISDNNGYYGIVLYDNSDYNNITDSIIKNNGGLAGPWDANILIRFNCNNNLIKNNTITGGYYYGVAIGENSDSNDVINNTFTGNGAANNDGGIYLFEDCDNNNLINNTIKNNFRGIVLVRVSSISCTNNIIEGNIIKNNIDVGIGFGVLCNLNTIKNNTIGNDGTRDQDLGIYFYNAGPNLIENNLIYNHTLDGIRLAAWSNLNDITKNIIRYNDQYGINIDASTEGSDIWNNTIIGNTLSNAYDDRTTATLNNWDNGIIGNYWNDYNGYDCDGDGIGETPYTNIAGAAGAQDNYPIWSIPDPNAPIIIENNINDWDVFGVSPPEFNLDINEYELNDTWYKLWNGTVLTSNFTFTYSQGSDISIDPGQWALVGNGTVTISFYANDTCGNWSFLNITVHKDIFLPFININLPNDNQLCNNTATEYQISLSGSNLDFYWYRLENGSVITSNSAIVAATEGLHSGSISQSLWDQIGNGTMTIRFFLNKTNGVIVNTTVDIYKDSIAPSITENNINDWDLFGPAAPIFNLDISEYNLNSTWYTLWNGSILTANELFTYNQGVDTSIQQTVWDQVGNGTVTISFYANDSAGNWNFLNITVYKDVILPVININLPSDNQICNQTAPGYQITLSGSNLDSYWYRLENGSITTANSSKMNANVGIQSGSINQALWNQVGNGTVTIRFFVNKTAEGLESNTIVIVLKDILAPNLNVVNPSNYEVRVKINRDFNFTVVECNLDTMWYSIAGGQNHEFTTNDTFNQAEWDAAWDATPYDGTFLISFYANDTAGNLFSTNIYIRPDKEAPSHKDDDDDDDDGIPGEEIITVVSYIIVFASIGAVIGISILFKFKIKKDRV